MNKEERKKNKQYVRDGNVFLLLVAGRVHFGGDMHALAEVGQSVGGRVDQRGAARAHGAGRGQVRALR